MRGRPDLVSRCSAPWAAASACSSFGDMPVHGFRFRAMLCQCRAEKHEDRSCEVPAQGFVEDDDTGEHREHRESSMSR